MRAQRRTQTRLVVAAVTALVVVLGAWQGYDYVASAPERAEAQVQAGMKLMSPDLYSQAVVQFSEALKTDPNSWNAYLQRGIAKQNLHLLDDALADFQTALRLKPELLAARAALAGVFSDKGDFQHAVEELTKVIDLTPSVDVYSRRGLAYAELGQHERAIADFTWVIEFMRDAPLAYFARAKSKRALGDLEGAASDEQFSKDLAARNK